MTVIDHELELLQIAARTPSGLSGRLDTAYAALIDGLTAWGPPAGKGRIPLGRRDRRMTHQSLVPMGAPSLDTYGQVTSC
jgi:hypothetical protein